MIEAETVSGDWPGWLEAEDLEVGKSVTVTIKLVRKPEKTDLGINGRPIETNLMRFAHTEKEWPLNKTNARILRRLYGNEIAKWKGKKVTLERSIVENPGRFKGKPCIRVVDVNPETGKPSEIL